MPGKRFRCARPFTFILFVLGATAVVCAEDSAQASETPARDPQALADEIAEQVANIRGLPFKRPIKVATQTQEAFGEYLDEMIGRQVPPEMAEHYGKIVRKLGLYRGPEIEDGPTLMKAVASSQVGAYYHDGTFYVLMEGMPDELVATLYAHELYHGLQDQYFDLEAYIELNEGERTLSGDELMARQAVVEGEATYVMTLSLLERMAGTTPPPEMVAFAVQQQASMDIDAARAMLKQAQVVAQLGDDLQQSMEALDELPRFIVESMLGAYWKGLGFVHAVQRNGWSEVEKLYSERPPASTEHILHPEKWVAQDLPSLISWQGFEKARVLSDWELLDDDVLGELQWRIIFTEHGFTERAKDLAEGWDGDRYAVFKRKGSEDDLLLLLYTTWDSEADATEFANAYRELLKVKCEAGEQSTSVVQKGTDVLIVEGGDKRSLASFEKLLRKAKIVRHG